nr:GTP-binding protein [uncultured Ralstonia sp.]
MNAQAHAGARQPIPLVVLGGYLGAGKTTLLNQLLLNATGRRVTVLVNDFGEINIDAALIRERGADVIQLENGCICCSIGGRLAEALTAIDAQAERPELLVIEASGVSDPLRIAQVGLLDRAFRLHGIVVAVDAERVQTTLQDAYIGDIARQQIAGATALVLTKTDLVDRVTADAAAQAAAAIAPHATMLQGHWGGLPLSVFFDAGELPPPSSGLLGRAGHWRSGMPSGIGSFTWRTSQRLGKHTLRQCLRDLPVPLLRAKGIVWLEAQAQPHAVHVVGGRTMFSPLAASDITESTLVFIGCFDSLAKEKMLRHLEAVLTRASDAVPI